MTAASGAAIVFAVVTVGAAGFQVALALGAPWGAYAMGGKFPGQFPAPMRVAAFVQALLLMAFVGAVLARAGLTLKAWESIGSWLTWVAVVFSAVSLVLNSITPSKRERLVWVPVAAVMLASSLTVALSG
ncbi:MAG: hypothetical protein KJ747_08095 [Actinobacteria bacterium]|nr:hypothetical protein [Actinomycetota bacterium]